MIQSAIPGHSLNILDYTRIIFRYRWLISGLVVVSVLVTGIICKLSPKLYLAEATLYPVREESLGGGISLGGDGGKEKGGGGGSAPAALDILGGKSSSLLDTMQVILNSRLIAETIVEQLGLTQYYGTDSKLAAAEALRAEVQVRLDGFKTFRIRVETKDPHMAATIANTYFSSLDEIYRQYKITNTRRNIAYIEARLAEKSKRLEEIENQIKAFQTEYKITGRQEDAGTTFEAAAALHAQIVELEVQLAALKEYAQPTHPMIKQLQVQKQELRNQLDRMDREQAQAFSERRKGRTPLSEQLQPAFQKAPELMLEYVRLTRKLKVEEAVYGMLVGMLEQSRLAVSRDTPTIQVLDAAIPPTHRSKPRTLQNMLVAAVASLLGGVLFAIFLNYLEGLQCQEAILSQRVGSDGDSLEDRENDSNAGEFSVIRGNVERLPG